VRVLVTGSSGHLGEALVRVLGSDGHDVVGLDVLESPHTSVVGSVVDRGLVRRHMVGVDAVIHAATLHKPHIATHDPQAFLDTNVSGTLNLLQEAAAAGVGAFVYTSTTSVFGRALRPPPDEPAAWITEEVVPVPRNIYGVTKAAAEDLCELAHRDLGLPCVILRTSRFFPEGDDEDDMRASFDDLNLKVNELLHRRVDLDDVVTAHRLAVERAGELGFGRYIISATSPFTPDDLAAVRQDAPAVVRRLFPDYPEVYEERGWKMLQSIDRVYVNARAGKDLDWSPRYDFRDALDRLRAGADPRSPLALSIGEKGYHAGRRSG
jgi:nucleoside-diphosphate-sugar epimerase